MSGPTAGQRFVQTKPVAGAAKGGLNPSVPGVLFTLLTVPAGKTYRLKDASISLSMATDSTYVFSGGSPSGAFATIQDSLGNTWAECECIVNSVNQSNSNGESRGPDIGAVLPAGTTLTINIAGNAATTTTGLYVRVGGGASWELS